jgi:hypothetical protein
MQLHWPVLGSHELSSDVIFIVDTRLQTHLEHPNGFSFEKLKYPSLHLSHFKPSMFCLQLHWAVFLILMFSVLIY